VGRISRCAQTLKKSSTTVPWGGCGWALSDGRYGSIASPLVGGFALAQGYKIRNILLAAGIPPIVCGLLVLWLNRLASEHREVTHQ